MYNYIIFDLDGTLSESAEGITKSVQYMLEKLGIIEPDLKKLECFIGPPLNVTLEGQYGMDKDTAWQGVLYYRERFDKIGVFENHPYNGIEDMLKALKSKGKTLAIATAKPQPQTDAIIKRYGFDKYFDVVKGPAPTSKEHTKADIVKAVIETLNCDKNRTLMVGDKSHDINGAKENGIKSLGVLYGYGSKKELEAAGADFVVETVKELKKFLLNS